MGNSCCCCCCRSSPPDQKLEYVPSVDTISSETGLPPPINAPSSFPPQFTIPTQPKIVVALDSYEARDSQNISISKGDRMLVRDESDKEWLVVEHLRTGQIGYIPGNFVAPEQSVESEDWFFGNTSRKEAEKLLLGDENQPRGTFLIRPSEHNPKGYSLSIKDWDEHRGYHVKHYRIKPLDNGGFYISPNKTHYSLAELVLAYSKNANGLCHVLTQASRKPKPPIWDLSQAYNDKWEIPRNELQLIHRLGRGHFGEVFYGKWKNRTEVAVKTLKHGSMSKEAFFQEAAIMKEFKHRTLVRLYGICSKEEPIYIVQEYLENGSLLDFLQTDNGRTIKFEEQVYIAQQVANGMAYLESRNFIHRDLAARNVMIGKENIAKVGDFGLARMMDDEIYAAHGGKWPVKWTAPEALMHSRFSTKSDVWSYGILLMELFTYGGTPYGNMSHVVVHQLVCKGYRMEKPENVPDAIYKLMRECWHEDPSCRPTFQVIEKYFSITESGGFRPYELVDLKK